MFGVYTKAILSCSCRSCCADLSGYRVLRE